MRSQADIGNEKKFCYAEKNKGIEETAHKSGLLMQKHKRQSRKMGASESVSGDHYGWKGWQRRKTVSGETGE